MGNDKSAQEREPGLSLTRNTHQRNMRTLLSFLPLLIVLIFMGRSTSSQEDPQEDDTTDRSAFVPPQSRCCSICWYNFRLEKCVLYTGNGRRDCTC